jgi:hypothetical protein
VFRGTVIWNWSCTSPEVSKSRKKIDPAAIGKFAIRVAAPNMPASPRDNSDHVLNTASSTDVSGAAAGVISAGRRGRRGNDHHGLEAVMTEGTPGVEQMVRSLLERAVEDGLVGPADAPWDDRDPRARTAEELAGVAGILPMNGSEPVGEDAAGLQPAAQTAHAHPQGDRV